MMPQCSYLYELRFCQWFFLWSISRKKLMNQQYESFFPESFLPAAALITGVKECTFHLLFPALGVMLGATEGFLVRGQHEQICIFKTAHRRPNQVGQIGKAIVVFAVLPLFPHSPFLMSPFIFFLSWRLYIKCPLHTKHYTRLCYQGQCWKASSLVAASLCPAQTPSFYIPVKKRISGQ